MLAPLIGRTSYELRLVELGANDELQRDGYRIAAFAVDHGGVAFGYALVEDDRPGRFDEERARELGVDAGPGLRAPAARRGGAGPTARCRPSRCSASRAAAAAW